MPRRFACLLCCGTALAACSTIMGPPDPPPPPPAPEPIPPVHQIIAAHRGEIFGPGANARNMKVSGVRRFDTPLGSEFGACMRALVAGMGGHDLGTVTYAVIVGKDRILDRRRATPADGCDRETYQPL